MQGEPRLETKDESSRKEKQMYTKKKRKFSIILSFLFLFVIFASIFYIAKEQNHHCTGEDCPICANIQQAEQVLKNLGDGEIAIVSIDPIPLLLVLVIVGGFLFVSEISLVSQKVRLND